MSFGTVSTRALRKFSTTGVIRMPWGFAILAGGVVAGAAIGGVAAGNAAETTAAAADTATAETARQFNIGQANQKPWLVTGTSALNKLGGMYGLDTYQPNYAGTPPATGSNLVQQPVAGNINQPSVAGGTAVGAVTGVQPLPSATGAPSAPGTSPQPAPGVFTPGSSQPGVDPYADFYKSPDYQFRFTEGMKGGVAAASAAGAIDSGATRIALTERAGNLAAGEFNTYANRLAALAGVGQTTATNMAGQGADYANQVGANAMWAGNNKASSYLAQGQNYGNAVNNLAGIGSGLLQNYPATFDGYTNVSGSAAFNPTTGNWTPGLQGF